MKDWVKEIIIGLVVLVVGALFVKKFLNYVVTVVLGSVGPLLVFLGVIFLWIGIED